MHGYLAFLLYLGYAIASSHAFAGGQTGLSSKATFTNPIVPKRGADPRVLEYNNDYYLTLSEGTDVQVRKSSTLASFPSSIQVYKPLNFTQCWAPEMHRIEGNFYIYLAMQTDPLNESHRIFVLKGSNATDPTAPFDLVGKITTPDNNWAIAGTVLQYGNSSYFIWSGWHNATNTHTQNLYIAKMASPTALTGSRALLHEPTPPWQQSTYNGVTYKINEGPKALVNGSRTFLIYSAAFSETGDYCLALMGIDNDTDPMLASNWWKDDTGPVMKSSSVSFGPGSATFASDHNGVPYIVYHAMQDPNVPNPWANRTIRTQSYGWNANNTPAFPPPVALHVPLPSPA